MALNTFSNLQEQEQKIFAEKIKSLYQILLPLLVFSLIVSAALAYGLWDESSKTVLSIWMTLIVLLTIYRAASYFFYKRDPSINSAKKYARHYIIGTAVAGVIWGFGSIIMFPLDNLANQFFIVFVLVGLGAGSLSTYTPHLPVFFSYLPVSIVPISIMLMLTGDTVHLSMGIMTIIYTIALSYYAINLNKKVTDSLKFRFENMALVEQLRQQKDEADLANKAKSKFLAAASHDLRQPLYSLSLFTSVLDESVQSPKVRRVVEQIKASVHSLQNLFNALLDISQLDAGLMKVEKINFYLQPLFKQLANDYDSQASEKGIHISWPSCDIAIFSDPGLFEQILRNYLSNAVRYTHNGTITVSYKDEWPLVEIMVSDTGIGIPVKDQQVIFEEFHQLSNPERDRSKGLGLGLAIVQRTAKLLGHSIDVTSQPGKGSAFSITAEQANMLEKAAIKTKQQEPESGQLANVTILVIDDEASIREGTQSLLQQWGCDVITAASEDDALEQLRQTDKPLNGIIADYRLRENKNGIEAIRAIKAEFNLDIPAMIVTGDLAIENLPAMAENKLQILHKPVAAVKLRTFLRNVQLHQQATESQVEYADNNS